MFNLFQELKGKVVKDTREEDINRQSECVQRVSESLFHEHVDPLTDVFEYFQTYLTTSQTDPFLKFVIFGTRTLFEAGKLYANKCDKIVLRQTLLMALVKIVFWIVLQWQHMLGPVLNDIQFTISLKIHVLP